MGNSSSSCCSRGGDDGPRCCCFSIGNKRGGRMVPADLHSSGVQTSRPTKDKKKALGISRPATLQTQSISVASRTSDNRGQEPRQKFSEFSLHGVQKTSPVEQSDESLNFQRRSVDQRFIVENVATFYNSYKDDDCDDILAEGVAKFCADLEVDPAEFVVLALAWKFKAATMCKFTREEFTQGCVSLKADSISSLKEAFPSLESEAMENFRDIYKFSFQFGLDVEQGQRSLPSDVAIGMWQVVFSKNPPVLLDDWFKFLEESKIRGISRDTWNMFLHFTENVGADLTNYDDNEAWPSLFDDFVEYFRSKKEEPPQLEKDHVEELEVEINLPQKEQINLTQKEQTTDEDNNHTQESPENTALSETENISLNIPGSVPSTEEVEDTHTEDEVSKSRNSLSECPSTAEEPSSEFDSEPIRCEMLHSSHFT